MGAGDGGAIQLFDAGRQNVDRHFIRLRLRLLKGAENRGLPQRCYDCRLHGDSSNRGKVRERIGRNKIKRDTA